MALSVKRQWTTMSLDEEARTALASYDVTGTQNPKIALAASGDGESVAQKNDPFEFDNNLKCSGPKVTDRPGLEHWIITCAFSIPDGGQFSDKDDPLNNPIKISWEFGSTSESIDIDKDGNPLVTSAQIAFDPLPQRDFTQIFLVAKRFERFFDIQQAIAFSNTVNTNQFNLAGAGVIKTGQAKCVNIRPTSEIEIGGTPIEIEYRFEIREDGFKTRNLDEGTHWLKAAEAASPSGLIPIYAANGKKVSEPQRLDGKGGRFGENDNGKGTPTGAVLEEKPNGVFLRYASYPEKNFGLLGL